MKPLDLSVIVVNWNAGEALLTCLESIAAGAGGMAYEILVVDNDSSDGSAQMVDTHFPDVTLIRNRDNVGFARANNQGIAVGQGRYVLLLNPDTIVLGTALGKLVGFLDAQPGVGIVGPKILTPGGQIDFRCARRLPTLASELFEKTTLSQRWPHSQLFGFGLMGHWDHRDSREVEALSGACMMIKRQVIEQVGLLDEDFHMYGEDIEFCDRVKRAGWQVFYYGDAEIIHLGGRSTAQIPTEMGVEALRSLNLFFRKRHGPAYAWAHRALMGLLTLAKQTVFFLRFVTARDAERRDQYQSKVRLHSQVFRWVLAG